MYKLSTTGLAVIILFIIINVVQYSLSASPPAAYPFLTFGGSVSNFPLLKVIGASSLSTKGPYNSSYATPGNLASPSRLRTWPAGVAPGNFTIGGLIAADNYYSRGVFYPNPITFTSGQGTIPFGQGSLSGPAGPQTGPVVFDPNSRFIDVARSKDLAVFGDDLRIMIWNITNFQLFATNKQVAQYPDYSYGQCSNCSYAQVSGATSVAADDDFIYFGVGGCSYILVWNTTTIVNSRSAYTEPQYAIGQNSISTCGSRACTDQTPVTCVSPRAMDTDCFGGLWVFDGLTSNILHFPHASRTADFTIGNITNGGEFTNLLTKTTSLSVNKGASSYCNFLAVTTTQYHVILSITYGGANNAVPTAASIVSILGSGQNSPTPADNTNSIGAAGTGVSWDSNNPDYLWISDLSNNRLVYFTPFNSTNTPSAYPSVSPSNTRSTGASSSSSPSTGSSQAAAKSSGAPSVASSGASTNPSNSPSNTPNNNNPNNSASNSPSNSPSRNNSPSNSPNNNNNPNGSASNSPNNNNNPNGSASNSPNNNNPNGSASSSPNNNNGGVSGSSGQSAAVSPESSGALPSYTPVSSPQGGSANSLNSWVNIMFL